MASGILKKVWVAQRKNNFTWWKRKKDVYEPLVGQQGIEDMELDAYNDVEEDEKPGPREEAAR